MTILWLSVVAHIPLLDSLAWPDTATGAFGLLFLLASVAWILINGAVSWANKLGSWFNPLLGFSVFALLAVAVAAR